MTTLPVFAIVMATMRDFVRFIVRHPLAILLAIAGSILLDQWLGKSSAVGDGAVSLDTFALSCTSVVAQLIVWLPLGLVAIREVVSDAALPLRLDRWPSAATWRYGIYNAVLLLAAEPISLIDEWTPSMAAAVLAIMIGLIWFSVRATLTFTSLALGRLDLGFARSIAKTSGQTLRLLAIMLLPLAPFVVAAVALLLLRGANDADLDVETSLWSAIAVVTAQLFMLAAAIAGAHVYRHLEAAPPQNGRY